MEHYLFVARSVTQAQRMVRVLSDAGISSEIRRAGADISARGCGYTIAISARSAQRAVDVCRAAGLRPTRILRVSGGTKQEVAL